MSDREERFKAARLLPAALRRFERAFESTGMKGRDVVLVLDQDPIASVTSRLLKCHSAVVAIYFERDHEIKFMALEPGLERDADEDGRAGVGNTSTIGMLYDHIHARSRRRTLGGRPSNVSSAFTFRITKGAMPIMASDLEPARGVLTR